MKGTSILVEYACTSGTCRGTARSGSAPPRSRYRRSRLLRKARRSAIASSAPPRCRHPRAGSLSRWGDAPGGRGHWSPAPVGPFRTSVCPSCARCVREPRWRTPTRAQRGREPEASAPWIRVEALVSKGSQADQEDRTDDDHRPDTQLAGPRNAAPLHGEGRHEPVDPERRPSDGEDELDRVHATQSSTSAWRYPLTGEGSRDTGPIYDALPLFVLPSPLRAARDGTGASPWIRSCERWA